ncbi:hypothetical protein OBBRIDRAFT_836957 [Obba rivulosa]|uniref:Uncharacterized protein n=1 Tax=Obba rivulosa TaxID=1052685 RepID=A0A8E2DMF6_9APHY|nr:hypothetical protein OBBRIDRAFT_836957 [Obba rivulosa]
MAMIVRREILVGGFSLRTACVKDSNRVPCWLPRRLDGCSTRAWPRLPACSNLRRPRASAGCAKRALCCPNGPGWCPACVCCTSFLRARARARPWLDSARGLELGPAEPARRYGQPVGGSCDTTRSSQTTLDASLLAFTLGPPAATPTVVHPTHPARPRQVVLCGGAPPRAPRRNARAEASAGVAQRDGSGARAMGAPRRGGVLAAAETGGRGGVHMPVPHIQLAQEGRGVIGPHAFFLCPVRAAVRRDGR